MLTPLRFESVIFDLDGTLVDSLPGIEASIRYALQAAALDLPLPSMRDLVGPPIATMLAKLWPDLAKERLQAIIAEFRHHYDAEGCLHSELYTGVAESIRTLRESGLRLFILTNKPHRPSQRILDHHGLGECFVEIVSPDSGEPPFTQKRVGAALLAQRHGLRATSTLLAGDGLDDLEAAMAHGFSFVSATYGYGSAARSESPKILARATCFAEIEHFALGTQPTLL
jgi:phosphoglycolate phosphatase